MKKKIAFVCVSAMLLAMLGGCKGDGPVASTPEENAAVSSSSTTTTTTTTTYGDTTYVDTDVDTQVQDYKITNYAYDNRYICPHCGEPHDVYESGYYRTNL